MATTVVDQWVKMQSWDEVARNRGEDWTRKIAESMSKCGHLTTWTEYLQELTFMGLVQKALIVRVQRKVEGDVLAPSRADSVLIQQVKIASDINMELEKFRQSQTKEKNEKVPVAY